MHVAPTSLESFERFFIYSIEDAPGTIHSLPSVSLREVKAEVRWHDSNQTAVSPQQYHVKVGVLPYNSLKVPYRKWCDQGASAWENMVLSPFAGDTAGIWSVNETNAYALFVLNCFKAPVVIDGTVTVKNAYGYLPGSDYPRMAFHYWLAVAYATLGVIWATLSIVWWRDLFSIQRSIACTIGLGGLESVLFYNVFSQWNIAGARPHALMAIATCVSVMKVVFSYVILWVASSGWGITRASLERGTITQIVAVTVSYVFIGFIRVVTIAFFPTGSFSTLFVFFYVLPVLGLNCIVYCSIFRALSKAIAELKMQDEDVKLQLFSRLSHILSFGVFCMMCMLIFTVHDISVHSHTRWRYQWMQSDGMLHVLFFLILAAMMMLWAPSKDSYRYQYQPLGFDNIDGELTVVVGKPPKGATSDEMMMGDTENVPILDDANTSSDGTNSL